MEFGSDFHNVEYPEGKSILEYFPESNLYASGRQALLDLVIARGWKRLWVPSYFCEESLDCVSRTGIVLCKYNITPLLNPYDIIEKIHVNRNDGVLIVNYFGLFDTRTFSDIGCEIVEDHTHNLIGNWALHSTADWCIASLRKTLPIADGGMLWSPRQHVLPMAPASKKITDAIMARRSCAMNLKRKYLKGDSVCKDEYLRIFQDTEKEFDKLPISAISDVSRQIVDKIDIREWNNSKHRNWNFLANSLINNKSLEVLSPENCKDCPFSLILHFNDNIARDIVRKKLIDKSVYPAILWNIEDKSCMSAKLFGDTMLSVHCDGRYTLENMEQLLTIIKDSLIQTKLWI